MFLRFDIFCIEEGDRIRWLGAFDTMDEARAFLPQNRPTKLTTYIALDSKTGQQQEIALELPLPQK